MAKPNYHIKYYVYDDEGTRCHIAATKEQAEHWIEVMMLSAEKQDKYHKEKDNA